MGDNGFVAVFALKRFIVHHKSHTVWLGFVVKVARKFSKKMYEFCLIERVLLHERLERFGGIIEGYIVVSFSDHDIEEGTILIPGKYSFTIS